MKRVIDKAAPGAPHEVLLVLDATNGQNAIAQARQFHEALRRDRPRAHQARRHRQGRRGHRHLRRARSSRSAGSAWARRWPTCGPSTRPSSSRPSSSEARRPGRGGPPLRHRRHAAARRRAPGAAPSSGPWPGSSARSGQAVAGLRFDGMTDRLIVREALGAAATPSRTRSATGSSRTTCSRCRGDRRAGLPRPAGRGGRCSPRSRRPAPRSASAPATWPRAPGSSWPAGTRRLLRAGDRTPSHGFAEDGEARELLVAAAVDRGAAGSARRSPRPRCWSSATRRATSRRHGPTACRCSPSPPDTSTRRSCAAPAPTGWSPPWRSRDPRCSPGSMAAPLRGPRRDSLRHSSPPGPAGLPRGPPRPPGGPARGSRVLPARRTVPPPTAAPPSDLLDEAEADADRRLLVLLAGCRRGAAGLLDVWLDQPEPGTAHLGLLLVREALQGQGLGREAAAGLEETLRAGGISRPAALGHRREPTGRAPSGSGSASRRWAASGRRHRSREAAVTALNPRRRPAAAPGRSAPRSRAAPRSSISAT